MSAVPAGAGASELVAGHEGLPLSGELPELAGVYWRRRADARTLRRADRLWTLSTVAHELPFLATAAVLPLLNPVTIPVAVIALAHAWFIPELYASRGAGAMRPPARAARRLRRPRHRPGPWAARRPRRPRGARVAGPHRPGARARLAGRTWLVGPAGALLVRPGGRRVQCYCVRATGDELPPTESPICCWPCAPTRADSPRSPT